MNWLRLFIPSWRFFDQLGSVPQLMYRVSKKSETTDWQPVFKKPQRQLHNLFFNPFGNLYLYHQSLVSRLADESQTATNLELVPTYQILKELTQEIIKQQFQNQNEQILDLKFQFKVSLHSENQKNPIDLITTEEMVLK